MKKADADILSALDPDKPKQAQIKEWIRKALEAQKINQSFKGLVF